MLVRVFAYVRRCQKHKQVVSHFVASCRIQATRPSETQLAADSASGSDPVSGSSWRCRYGGVPRPKCRSPLSMLAEPLDRIRPESPQSACRPGAAAGARLSRRPEGVPRGYKLLLMWSRRRGRRRASSCTVSCSPAGWKPALRIGIFRFSTGPSNWPASLDRLKYSSTASGHNLVANLRCQFPLQAAQPHINTPPRRARAGYPRADEPAALGLSTRRSFPTRPAHVPLSGLPCHLRNQAIR